MFPIILYCDSVWANRGLWISLKCLDWNVIVSTNTHILSHSFAHSHTHTIHTHTHTPHVHTPPTTHTQCFTSIVGPNGSGKSNVIDSMLFVFGYRARKIRSKKVSVLIHNSTHHQHITSCTVSVHFRLIKDLVRCFIDKCEYILYCHIYCSGAFSVLTLNCLVTTQPYNTHTPGDPLSV